MEERRGAGCAESLLRSPSLSLTASLNQTASKGTALPHTLTCINHVTRATVPPMEYHVYILIAGWLGGNAVLLGDIVKSWIVFQ
jgi:hypothetical protein